MKRALWLGLAALGAFVAWWHWPQETPSPAAGTAVVAPASVPDPGPETAAIDERQAVDPGAAAAGSAAAAPVRGACSVRVVDGHGVAVPGVEVCVWTSEPLRVWRRESDAQGRCGFADAAGPGGLLVAADHRLPLVQQLPELRGVHELVLAEGAAIAGTLTVDGQPGAGWRLQLRPSRELKLPDALYGVGGEAECDRNGAFCFVGLPDGWTGQLLLPQSLWPQAGEERGLAVQAPRHGIELLATQLPGFRGRVFWSDGEAVPWPHLLAWAQFADHQTSPSFGLRGRRDGSFAMGFHGSQRLHEWSDPTRRPPLQRVLLTASDSDQAASVQMELGPEQLRSAAEVRIELPRPSRTHVLVRDTHGTPVAGARVLAGGVSEPSGADGRLVFAGTPHEVRMVGAPQHRIGPTPPCAAAAGTAEDPLVFELLPTNVVVCKLAGASASGWRCAVRSDDHGFAGNRRHGQLDRILHPAELQATSRGRNQPDGTHRTYDSRVEFRVDARGEFALYSLEPGVACEFLVYDDLQRPLAKAKFVAPPYGQSLEVVAQLPETILGFAGRVTTAAGQPLSGVEVSFATLGDGAGHASRQTDAQGRFELRCSGDLGAVELRLEHPGFVELVQRSLVAGQVLHTFVLERERTVLVRVVDEAGRPNPVIPEWRDERSARREDLGDGVFRLGGLPQGSVELGCRIGAEQFVFRHDTAVAEATLRVPRPGWLRLAAEPAWPVLSRPAGGLLAVVTCTDSDRQPVRIHNPAMAEACQLLPGTWRVELFEWYPGNERGAVAEQPLGLRADVAVRAGETTTAILR